MSGAKNRTLTRAATGEGVVRGGGGLDLWGRGGFVAGISHYG